MLRAMMVLVFLSLSACGPEELPHGTGAEVPPLGPLYERDLRGRTRAQLLAEQRECLARGGEFARAGMRGFNCILPASDAGKSCTSSDQCESHCLSEGGGICAPTVPYFGCFGVLQNGRKATLCVD